MKTHTMMTVQIPSYALSYLINDDGSGLPPRDKGEIDRYMSGWYALADNVGGDVVVSVISPETDEFFSWYPEFGQPCVCVDCNILVLVPE